MSPFDGPARWSGSGKRSVQAKPTKGKTGKPAAPETVEAPETGTEVTLDEPAPETETGYMKTKDAGKGSAKTGG